MKRLDQALVSWGLAPTRSKAQQLIKQGEVEVHQKGQWQKIEQTSFNVQHLRPEDVRLNESSNTLKYVSRGGLKLEAALDHLQLNVDGWRCLDVGLSTGGFADVLLGRGAAGVLGIEVGRDQLHPSLHQECRLTAIEGLHIKDAASDERVVSWLKNGVQLAVVDVSFISLKQVLPHLKNLLPPKAMLLALFKPQFEVGPEFLNKRGIVKDADQVSELRKKMSTALDQQEFSSLEDFPCAIKGQDGNQEYFFFARRR